MNLEIQNPELIERLNAHIQAGHFHNADELIEKALDALDERVPPDASPETHEARTACAEGDPFWKSFTREVHALPDAVRDGKAGAALCRHVLLDRADQQTRRRPRSGYAVHGQIGAGTVVTRFK